MTTMWIILGIVIWLQMGIVGYELMVSWQLRECPLSFKSKDIPYQKDHLIFILCGGVNLLVSIGVHGWSEKLIFGVSQEMIEEAITKKHGPEMTEFWRNQL